MISLRIDPLKLQDQMTLSGFETKADLAAVANIEASNLSHILGRKYVQNKTLAKLCKALNCSAKDITISTPLEKCNQRGAKTFILAECETFDLALGEPVYIANDAGSAMWGVMGEHGGKRAIHTCSGHHQHNLPANRAAGYRYYALKEVD